MFVVPVTDFKSDILQHDVSLINCGPIQRKINENQGTTSSGYLVIDKLLMLSVCPARCGHFWLQKLRKIFQTDDSTEQVFCLLLKMINQQQIILIC